jgi:hypothetical protein
MPAWVHPPALDGPVSTAQSRGRHRVADAVADASIPGAYRPGRPVSPASAVLDAKVAATDPLVSAGPPKRRRLAPRAIPMGRSAATARSLAFGKRAPIDGPHRVGGVLAMVHQGVMEPARPATLVRQARIAGLCYLLVDREIRRFKRRSQGATLGLVVLALTNTSSSGAPQQPSGGRDGNRSRARAGTRRRSASRWSHRPRTPAGRRPAGC